MAKKILEEAIKDTKLLKETAIQNAHNILVEAISPKIKEFVDSQLGEGEEEMEDELDESGDGIFEVEDGEDELPFRGGDVEEGMYEAVDDDENEVDEVVEITDEDLKRAFSEVVGEATVSKSFADVEDPNVPEGPGQTGIADEKSGEHHWKDEEAPASEDWTVESKRLKTKVNKLIEMNRKLQAENREYVEAVEYLRRNLNEVTLFNSRLVHATKLLQKYNLNENQRVAVIEAFDRARSMREVELTYSNFRESFKIAGSVLGESKNIFNTSRASRPAVSSSTSKILKEQVEKEAGGSYVERLQKLSGLLDK